MRFAEKNNIYVNNEKIALNCALKIKLQKYKKIIVCTYTICKSNQQFSRVH